jgi:hypothetical protein
MSVEILEISHETIGRNLLLYHSLCKLRVAEIIDQYTPSEAEISVGTIAENGTSAL